MRKRYGEKITGDSLLVREQFDVRNPGKPKEMNRNILMKKIVDLCNRAGINKSDIPACHGFRKFFTKQLHEYKVDKAIIEFLLGHKIGLTSAYYKPDEQELFLEYQKAINNLTINEENRLRETIEVLTIEKSKVDFALSQIEDLKKQIGLD